MFPSAPIHYKVTQSPMPLELWRLNDLDYHNLRELSFRIQFNQGFKIRLIGQEIGCDDALNLPRAYLALRSLFGLSSQRLDHSSQTFVFPFLMQIKKKSRPFNYLLVIEDIKGSIYFMIHRVMDCHEYQHFDPWDHHKPIEEELNQAEMEELITYFWGYLKFTAQQLLVEPQTIQPFVHQVDASQIIYGFWDGKCVELEVEDDDDYEETAFRLRSQYEPEVEDSGVNLNDVQRLIHSITSS
jgi:hypothetical protein